MALADQDCIPCKGGVPPLAGTELEQLHNELEHDWQLVDEHHLEKTFRLKNFVEALEFTNLVGNLAEEVGHHPDIELGWGRVKLVLWTHKIDGLTESDFVWAAKAERLFQESFPGAAAAG